MTRSTATQTFNTFVAGLITEATPLTQPANSSTAEDNCILLNRGNRTRRRGVDFEAGFVLSTQTPTTAQMSTYAVETFVWKAVAGNGSTNFMVVQLGNTLSFFDMAAAVSVSAGVKSFTVNLNTFLAPSFATTADTQVQFDYGKGVLFVTGEKINPFYVQYNAGTDTITTQAINIQIRDFAGVDDGLAVETEPAVLTPTHNYNLLNQGWLPTLNGENRINIYFTNAGVYPNNAQQWFLAKTDTNEFNVANLRRLSVGNTQAPRGHYIVDAFRIDRSAVSGIAGLPIVTTVKRPTTVAFYAGRVFYSGVNAQGVNGNVYFSQVLETIEQAGRCYQVGDPSSEESPDLVDTDGGVIVIPDAGSIKKLMAIGSSLVVFADNGVWAISGADKIFRATDYSMARLSTDGVLSATTLVNAGGTPVWWSEGGIFSLNTEEVSGNLQTKNISETSIQTFFNSIPADARIHAKGAYDRVGRKVVWMYKNSLSPNDVDRYHYTNALWLDLSLKAFYPWSISELAVDSPYIASVVESTLISTTSVEENVVDSSSTLVVDSSVASVVADTGSTLSLSTQLKFLAIAPTGAGTVKFTFANFDNGDLVDWQAADLVGAEYSTYVETWYELGQDITRYKQAPYIYTYCNRTETVFISDGMGGFDYDNPSSLLVTPRWNFANSVKSGQIGRQFQAYQLHRMQLVDPLDTTVDTGYPLVVTRNKLRGKGRALQLRFESEGNKDFNLYGWAVVFEGNNAV